jgi:hypothetical protein
MKRFNRQRTYDGIKDWTKSMENYSASSYRLDRLAEHVGGDPLAVISKMSGPQLQVVLSLVAAANSLGFEQSRQQRRELMQDKFNKPVFERRSNFKVIQGGAA